MIVTSIFIIHFIFIAFVFVKKLKQDKLQSAIINVILIIILFTIGWSLSVMLIKLLIPSDGFTKEINYDSLSLLFLTIIEIPFYKIFFGDIFTSVSGKEK